MAFQFLHLPAWRTLFFAVLALIASSGIRAQEVVPDFYHDPGRNPNRSYINQNFNEHIDPFTESLQHHYVDISLPDNGGFNLNVIRSYNSASIDPLNPIRPSLNLKKSC